MCPNFSVAFVFLHESYNIKDSLYVALQDVNCLKLTVRKRMRLLSSRLWCGCLKWSVTTPRKASCFFGHTSFGNPGVPCVDVLIMHVV